MSGFDPAGITMLELKRAVTREMDRAQTNAPAHSGELVDLAQGYARHVEEVGR